MRSKPMTVVRLIIGIITALAFVGHLIMVVTLIGEPGVAIGSYGAHGLFLFFEAAIAFVCLRKPKPPG